VHKLQRVRFADLATMKTPSPIARAPPSATAWKLQAACTDAVENAASVGGTPGLGVDIEGILTPPCIFGLENH
jgi:hypothetical protein